MTGLLSVGKTKDTTDVELVHPVTGETLYNGDGSAMTVTIHGPYSSRYKSVLHEQQNKRLAKATRTGGKLSLTAEEIEAGALDLIVKCIEGWNLTLETEKEPFSEAKARETLIALPWVKEQIDAAFGDTRAFLA